MAKYEFYISHLVDIVNKDFFISLNFLPLGGKLFPVGRSGNEDPATGNEKARWL